jgi:hypothetical protein
MVINSIANIDLECFLFRLINGSKIAKDSFVADTGQII